MLRQLSTVLICAILLIGGIPHAVQANAQATEIVNSLRAQNGRAALKYSRRLEKVALRHAQDMKRQNRMTHKGSDGSDMGQRARKSGYKYCYISENVALGPWDLNGVIRAWANSKGHAKNMLNKKAREFAVAQAPGGFWVMLLAKPGCR